MTASTSPRTSVAGLAALVPLEAGQIASPEYGAVHAPSREPTAGYHRVAHARADSVDLVVEFLLSRRPAHAWRAVRDHHQGRWAHRFVPALEHAAAGFRRTW
ncbi:hypothetical protein ACF09Z_38555 [Streptomyces erythrochromogenes]|uniref:hypothetical protein n=1 Tax=Streptomyces erythrochromogenes TaxID=285574 RepID=UPI0036F5E7C5